MTISFDDFIRKYGLDDFSEKLELKPNEKVEFYTNLTEIMKTVNTVFDKLSTIAAGNCIRGGQVLMSIAKLKKHESVINKTDIKNCLNIERLEQLKHSFEYLMKQKYIKIIEKTSKFHIVELNEKDNPDLVLFREIVQKYWRSPEEEITKTRQWSDQK